MSVWLGGKPTSFFRALRKLLYVSGQLPTPEPSMQQDQNADAQAVTLKLAYLWRSLTWGLSKESRLLDVSSGLEEIDKVAACSVLGESD